MVDDRDGLETDGDRMTQCELGVDVISFLYLIPNNDVALDQWLMQGGLGMAGLLDSV